MVRASSYRKANSVLFVANVALAGYVLFAPFLPQLGFAFSPRKVADVSLDVTEPEKTPDATSAPESAASVPDDNTLVIPAIGVDGIIHEGKSLITLNKGVWRRPKSSTPDKGGNTVLVAHRFLYTSGPNTFYHLDKLKAGDRFAVFWDKKQYVYQVSETRTVRPEEIDIEAETHEPTLTLYTCTPIFTADKRLVVRARLIHGT